MTRVGRVESRMWGESGAGAGAALLLAVYFATRPVQPLGLWTAAGLVVIAVGVLVLAVRRRSECVIEPGRVGFGSRDGRMWWVDRARLGSVRIHRDSPVVHAHFLDHRGKVLAGHVFAFFDANELREALTSAGIAVR